MVTPALQVPSDVLHPALSKAAEAAVAAVNDARSRLDRAALAEPVAMGADATPTMRIDQIVEDAILSAVHPTVEVVRYEGGAGAVPLLVGVE